MLERVTAQQAAHAARPHLLSVEARGRDARVAKDLDPMATRGGRPTIGFAGSWIAAVTIAWGSVVGSQLANLVAT